MALDLITQLYIDGAWTTYPSFSEQGWSTSVGPDPETGLAPNRCVFTLQDPDLEMDPTNVSSALYGKIGRNTPVRIRIDSDTLTVAQAKWQPSRTVDHTPGAGRGLSMMAVTGEGLLSQLGRWEDPLDSPMRRQISSYSSLTGYWPLEDPSGSTNLAQMVTGLGPGRYSGSISLAGDEGAGGSGPSVVMGTDGRLDGRFLTPSGSGWQVSWVMKMAAVPGGAGYNVMFAIVDTLGRTWNWQTNDTTHRIVVSDGDGTVLETSGGVGFGAGIVLTEWVRYRLKVTVSGSTVTYEPAWYMQDDETPFGFTDTFSSSSTGRPRDWRVTYNSYVDGTAYGHVFAVTDTSLDLVNYSNDARKAFNGYLAETAGARFTRLMTEAGLESWISGTSADSAPMGRQKPARLLDLLTQCAVSDGGLLFDDPVDNNGLNRLTLRLHNDLINRTPALDLEYGVDVSPPLIKTVDDVNVANDVTATNWDGTAARVEKTTGPLSTAVPPSGVGRYRRPLDVSLLSDAQVANRANFELVGGTLDRPRYKAVVVDLLSHPSLRATVTAMRPGDWITLAEVEPDPITLMVMQIQRNGDGVRDTATLKCVPAEPYMVGEYDDGIARYDSSSTILVGSLTTSGTSVKIGTTDPAEVWSTTAEPYDVVVTGERMTVTNMTAADGDATLTSGSFESGVTGWDATSCTLTQSSTFAFDGTFSGLMTVTGSPTSAYYSKASTQRPRVVPGQEYTASARVRSVAGLTDVRVFCDWLEDDNTTQVSSSDSGAASLSSGSWVQRTVTATAPDGAAYARYGVVIRSSPSAGTLLYTDAVILTATSARYQTATLTRSVNGVVKAHTGGEEVHIANPGRWALGGE
jgi:hypothetical protein